MEKQKLYIDGYNLTIEDVVSAVKGELGPVIISDEASKRCRDSRKQIDKWVEKDAPVIYGVNTGLGNLKDTVIPPEVHKWWQKSLSGAHAAGFGDPISPDITRAELLIRANVLCRGYSAVRVELIQRMLDLFNAGISPVVLELGSTGLSDLGPLSQSAMVVAGIEGAEAYYNGIRGKAEMVFQNAGIGPQFDLECKELLSQMNGSTMTQAMAVLTFDRVEKLFNIIRAMIIEYGLSKGQYEYEKVFSDIDKSMRFAKQIINFENNITCDNPLLFKTEDGSYVPRMGCNCSNTQVGYVLDLINILIADMVCISYRAISEYSESNTFLTPIQNMLSSICLTLRGLCIPASADSISTKGNQEDHVEFSFGAARKVIKASKLLLSAAAYGVYSVHLLKGPCVPKNNFSQILENIEKDALINEPCTPLYTKHQRVEQYISKIIKL